MRLATITASVCSLAIPAAALILVAACSAKPTTDDIRVGAEPKIGAKVVDFVAPCQTLEAGTGQSCGVSAMLERRCGSLDCHGFVRRPFRLYSKYGLRLPPVEGDGGLEPGLGETTPEERSANYRAAFGVEPEQTELVAQEKAEPNTLLIYKKPLMIEKHKGGPAINKGDDSEACLVSWLKGETDRIACGKAAELP